MKTELSVIIVNYNGLKYLKDCFDSLYAKLENIPFEIIVVDNNSSDESCAYIKKNYPNIVLIESKENLGFGQGNNLGVKNAKSEAILLINNDTIVLDNLQPALKLLLSDPTFGIVSINMLGSKKEYIPAVSIFPTPFRLLRISFLKDNRKEFLFGNFDKNKIYEADWVTGAFMLIRKSDYERVNGFDPDYFMYVEDVDLCKKIANLGKKCIFMPALNYIHFVGFNKTRENLLIQGYEIYSGKHFKGFSLLIAKTMLKINKWVKMLKNKI